MRMRPGFRWYPCLSFVLLSKRVVLWELTTLFAVRLFVPIACRSKRIHIDQSDLLLPPLQVYLLVPAVVDTPDF